MRSVTGMTRCCNIQSKFVKYFLNIIFTNLFFRCKLSIVVVTAILWLQSTIAIAEVPPGSVDLLDKFRFRDNAAVETTNGFCRTREGPSYSDVAFKLTRKAVISVPTATAFPGMIRVQIFYKYIIFNNSKYVLNLEYLDGFPFDFSILATFKSTDRGQLFTVYSADGSLILSVRIGRRIVLMYKGGGNGRKDRVRFRVKVEPGKWHRLGISIKVNDLEFLYE